MMASAIRHNLANEDFMKAVLRALLRPCQRYDPAFKQSLIDI
jgi:hypothetical protein